MSAREWWKVLKRTWAEGNDDNIGLIAAGTAFYGFAAIVPLLASVVLIYGLVADTETVVANIRALFNVLPDDAARVIGDQLATVVNTSEGKKGFGLVIALGIALYGGTKGASSIVTALNIAYEEKETRGFIALYLLAFAITGGAVLLALVAALSTAAFALLDSLIPGAPDILLLGIRLVSYGVLASLGVTAAACLYRFGPNRRKAKWAWLTPGSLAATLVWLGATIGFGIYVSRFGNYGATYGSLSAVIVLLTWLWLSAYVFLLGAELNSELEHQTTADTTTGTPTPMGTRGATVADTVATEAKSEAAPRRVTRPAEPSGAGVLAVARLSGAQAGLPASLLAIGGLRSIRRGSPVAGLGMMAIGAALAHRKRAATRTTAPSPQAKTK
ncbi:YihY/virulence factor BrkB family protein [Sphingomonas faeni]|uniref:YihY/virulence factor BrkB family protein n=1 Tax=Sphingomonas faeni TaxID=185950 RepID=UPI00278813AC|nr:YihY/virulence factor BrkB family protein [Sphingomonas faeni]MDQ0837007.1 YihY family inner membrane protein [Sphingomonas faeni]